MGPDTGELFVQALRRGAVEVIRLKVIIVGKDRVGKTSLKRSMLKQLFQQVAPSTPVANAELAVCEATNWREVGDKIKFLDQQIARVTVHVSQHRDVASAEVSEGLNSTRSEQTEGSQHADNEDEQESIDAQTVSSLIDNSINAEELKTAAALSEVIAHSIEEFRNDPQLMKQEASKFLITIWDFGGQEPLLPGQTHIITPGSFVLVVFNASEPLNDTAKSFVLPSPTSCPIPVHNFWMEKNYDAIALWARTLSLAGDEHHVSSALPTIVRWAYPRVQLHHPCFWLVHTQKMKKKGQNAYLSEKFCSKSFVKHII